MQSIAAMSIPIERVRVKFDQNKERQYNACTLYDSMLHRAGLKTVLEEQITFGDHRTCVDCKLRTCSPMNR